MPELTMKQREIKFRWLLRYGSEQGMRGPKDIFQLTDARDEAVWGTRFDPNHVVWMQYTGLKDKDGLELWEGDVRGYPDGDASVFVVEFRDGAFCANYGKGEDGYDVTPRIDHFHLEQSVHLGNIYENPELIP